MARHQVIERDQRRWIKKGRLSEMMNRDRIRIAIQNALVSLAAYLVGYYVTASSHRSSSSIRGGLLWP